MASDQSKAFLEDIKNFELDGTIEISDRRGTQAKDVQLGKKQGSLVSSGQERSQIQTS